jgi:hypothetical protein
MQTADDQSEKPSGRERNFFCCTKQQALNSKQQEAESKQQAANKN